jgi:hypothetical protein
MADRDRSRGERSWSRTAAAALARGRVGLLFPSDLRDRDGYHRHPSEL